MISKILLKNKAFTHLNRVVKNFKTNNKVMSYVTAKKYTEIKSSLVVNSISLAGELHANVSLLYVNCLRPM